MWLKKVKSKYNSALDAAKHTLSTIYWESIVETSLPTFFHFWVTEIVLSRDSYYCNVFDTWKRNIYLDVYSRNKDSLSGTDTDSLEALENRVLV